VARVGVVETSDGDILANEDAPLSIETEVDVGPAMLIELTLEGLWRV